MGSRSATAARRSPAFIATRSAAVSKRPHRAEDDVDPFEIRESGALQKVSPDVFGRPEAIPATILWPDGHEALHRRLRVRPVVVALGCDGDAPRHFCRVRSSAMCMPLIRRPAGVRSALYGDRTG